jgi:hypothetical protein
MPATFYIASLPFQDTPPNGGSARGYQAIFVPLAALSSPATGLMDGQPAVYFSLSRKAVWEQIGGPWNANKGLRNRGLG